jgi:translation initiation factor 1A
MPKNKGKGGKNRRRGKNENEPVKRELVYATHDQAYAKVTKMLGNGRLLAEDLSAGGKSRLCHIRGKLRKKVWINAGDIILLGLRDFQDEKADVLARYLPEEAKRLQKEGEISANVDLSTLVDNSANAQTDYSDIAFVTGDGDDSDEEGEHRNVDFPQQPNASLPLSSSESEEEESEDEDLAYNTNKLSNFVLDSD